ncbi:hypothetical protein [Aquabacterium sp.]|uniref:hypothetical protein n=1 Tax=Aquabacterium sp. TaxID=1872578 RepID=UPI0019CA8A25|nr:hypothetical protein [Aquabacterium sp.]MBC7699192.1 hypothetical protein [Aquabacterium sp.]
MHVLIINPNMRMELTAALVEQLTPFVSPVGLPVIGLAEASMEAGGRWLAAAVA